jgi:hypothetical protein
MRKANATASIEPPCDAGYRSVPNRSKIRFITLDREAAKVLNLRKGQPERRCRYQEALHYRAPEAPPSEYAATQRSLSSAYRNLRAEQRRDDASLG